MLPAFVLSLSVALCSTKPTTPSRLICSAAVPRVCRRRLSWIGGPWIAFRSVFSFLHFNSPGLLFCFAGHGGSSHSCRVTSSGSSTYFPTVRSFPATYCSPLSSRQEYAASDPVRRQLQSLQSASSSVLILPYAVFPSVAGIIAYTSTSIPQTMCDECSTFSIFRKVRI